MGTKHPGVSPYIKQERQRTVPCLCAQMKPLRYQGVDRVAYIVLLVYFAVAIAFRVLGIRSGT